MDNLKPFKDGEDKRRENSGRKPTKFITELLIKESRKKRDIVIEGIEMISGVATGRKVKVKIPMPTKEVIVQAHLRECAKGKMDAIKEYYDRVEGKITQPLGNDPDNPLFPPPALKLPDGTEVPL